MILIDQIKEIEYVENNEHVGAKIEESIKTETEQPLLVEAKIESEQLFHDLTMSQSNQPPKNISEVQVLNFPQNIYVGYKLPFRHNRGQPPNRYSPNHGTSKSKHPIANCVSTYKLSKPLKALVYNISADDVPHTVNEGMKNPKWIQAIEEEMKASQENNTWSLVPFVMPSIFDWF